MDALQIERYRHGEIVVDGKRYRQDVILAQDVSLCWQHLTRRHRLPARCIKRLLEQGPDVVIIGLGAGAKLGLTSKAISVLETSGVEWHALPTKNACNLYNRLSQKFKVVALLHVAS